MYILTRGKVIDLIGLCACADNPYLDAPLLNAPARDLYPSASKTHYFSDLCACAGDPELDAPPPVSLTCDLHPSAWKIH